MSHVSIKFKDAPVIPRSRTIVAVVVEWQGKIALFRRSQKLTHDSGLWHCITGYLEKGATPAQQAADELIEETGLHPEDLLDLLQGPDVILKDDRDKWWMIHTFIAVSNRRRLKIDWEHDAYRWTPAGKTKRFGNRVPWLDQILTATGHL